MGLSLDCATYNIPPSSASDDRSQRNLDAHLHAIRSTPSAPSLPTNASNRWFDKPFTLILDPAARAGAMGEHSPLDALVPSIVAEYALVQSVDQSAFKETPRDISAPDKASTSDPANPPEGWSRLPWIVSPHLTHECTAALKRADSIIQDSDNSVMWFAEYGADWIRTIGELLYIRRFLLSHYYLIVFLSPLSQTKPGRLHSTSPSARLVPYARSLHRDLRNCPHAHVPSGPYGDRAHAH